MSRLIIILLLLVVFFFGGVSYGAYERESSFIEPIVEEEIVEEVEEVNLPVNITPIENHQQNKDNMTQKTAAFFEKVVNKFYELLVKVLYSIANLFF